MTLFYIRYSIKSLTINNNSMETKLRNYELNKKDDERISIIKEYLKANALGKTNTDVIQYCLARQVEVINN